MINRERRRRETGSRARVHGPNEVEGGRQGDSDGWLEQCEGFERRDGMVNTSGIRKEKGSDVKRMRTDSGTLDWSEAKPCRQARETDQERWSDSLSERDSECAGCRDRELENDKIYEAGTDLDRGLDGDGEIGNGDQSYDAEEGHREVEI